MLFVDVDPSMKTDVNSTPPVGIKEEFEEHHEETNLEDLNMEAGQGEPLSREILGKEGKDRNLRMIIMGTCTPY